MSGREKILICPLNWGLGHASRCIPIIRILEKNDYNVFLAASGNAYYLLEETFPHLPIFRFEDYNITYTKGKNLTRKIFFQTPGIFLKIFREHRRLKKLIRELEIDLVISDNRFGLWNKKTKTVYITHQVRIKAPGDNRIIEQILFKIHGYFIRKFNICWVPDFAEDFKMAGSLSGNDKLPGNAQYIGTLSRFSKPQKEITKDFDLCVLLSGPEPQRSIFEEIILAQLKRSDYKAVVLLGQPSEHLKTIIDGRIHIFSSLLPDEIQNYILRSEVVLARSGYSTIMDLATLGSKAILVPTPGQTEQEYLANYLSEKNIYYTVTQQNFNLDVAMDLVKTTTGILKSNPADHLEKVILDSIT
ncbi:MAG: glycosyltransferase [Bacteroidota bacterium]